jgi:hypothetical protein
MRPVLLLIWFSALTQAQTAGPGVPIVYRVSQIIPAADAESGCAWNTGLRTVGLACNNDVS